MTRVVRRFKERPELLPRTANDPVRSMSIRVATVRLL